MCLIFRNNTKPLVFNRDGFEPSIILLLNQNKLTTYKKIAVTA